MTPPVRLCAIDATELAGTEVLWAQICDTAPPGTPALTVPAVLDRVRSRIVASAAETDQGRPETYALTVALDAQDRPVGLLSVSVVDDSLLAFSRHVVIDALHVDPCHRSHGIGRELLRDATDFAGRLGVEEIAVQIPQHARGLNRFFADWGFAPGVVRRTTPVAALGHRLGVDLGTAPASEAVALSHMQRLLRRRAVLVGRSTHPVRIAR